MPFQEDHPAFQVMVVGLTAAALVVLLLIFSIAAIQAKRRGYSFFVWLFAGLFVLNPIYLLVVLATVPHRKRQAMRTQFATELDSKLVGARSAAASSARPVPDRSIGDLGTFDPRTTSGQPLRDRSLGDEETRG